MPITIYYDGDCPFCTRYVRFLRLQETAGPVKLIDLRNNDSEREELQMSGFNLDQGMVVDLNGDRIAGADAVNALALMSSPFDGINRINRLLFSSPTIAKLIYPLLRAGRWITLFLMGRFTISSKATTAPQAQTLFAFFFALFSLFHVFNYAFAYGRYPPSIDLIGIFGAASLLLLRPSSPRILFLLMLVSLISTIIQAPAQSNHTMLRTAVLAGYWLSFGLAWLRATQISDVFDNFILAGRGSLLVMYFFGIFHKINSDFINPATSCAVRLWQEMPYPLSTIHGSFIDLSVIYGTFVVEGAIMLALINSRTRYIGLVFGILFHVLLSLSGYAPYIAFTTLAISLHLLFLNQTQVSQILRSPEMAIIRSRARHPLYILAFVALLIGGAIAMIERKFSMSAAYLLPLILPLCVLILKQGRGDMRLAKTKHTKLAYLIGLIAAGFYFANCAMPYLGLKTAQSTNMFSNLRLEAKVSNHLIFRSPPGPFKYLEDVALITDAGTSAFLLTFQRNGYGIVYYDLISHLSEHPKLIISYELNGQQFTAVTAKDVAPDISKMLHARWVRKWFHFQPVQLQTPEQCSV